MFDNIILKCLHFSKVERNIINQIFADSRLSLQYFVYYVLRSLVVASIGAGSKDQKQFYEILKHVFPGKEDFQPTVPRPEKRGKSTCNIFFISLIVFLVCTINFIITF